MIRGWIDLGVADTDEIECGALPPLQQHSVKLKRRTLHIEGQGGAVSLSCGANRIAIACGNPTFKTAALAQASAARGRAAAWLELFDRAGERAAESVGGNFAVVVLEPAAQRAYLAVDRFAVNTLCYCVEGSRLSFAD